MSTASNTNKELAFLLDYESQPYNYSMIKRAKVEGLLDSPRSRDLKALNERIKQAHDKGYRVFFNHRAKQWESAEQVGPRNHSYDNSHDCNWRGAYIKGNDKYAQLNCLYGLEYEFQVLPDYVDSVDTIHQEIDSLWLDIKSSGFTLKMDSTIGSYDTGRELVTTPMDYLSLHQQMKHIFRAQVPQTKLFTDTRCGIHIHTSREPFSTRQALGLFFMVHYYQKFMSLVGDRGGNSYNIYRREDLVNNQCTNFQTFWKKILSDPSFESSMTDKFKSHYSSLSVSNRGTFEFRIFQSTTSMDKMLRYIEFVDSLCMYVKEASFNLSLEEYLVWLQDPFGTRYKEPDRKFVASGKPHPRYPNLHKFLIDQGVYTNVSNYLQA